MRDKGKRKKKKKPTTSPSPVPNHVTTMDRAKDEGYRLIHAHIIRQAACLCPHSCRSGKKVFNPQRELSSECLPFMKASIAKVRTINQKAQKFNIGFRRLESNITFIIFLKFQKGRKYSIFRNQLRIFLNLFHT
ncbi:hypothetical protein AVEN_163959-1 [Araneus ventricosus]|uniref:Uncharacterized protein n=1 Tax=Araneus ventricosus TaxID=182803 RepID=A0A4Y2WHL3_ARAVE|nr:hypothetical protein AVEN_163959-1 [Araneus ventricosus]